MADELDGMATVESDTPDDIAAGLGLTIAYDSHVRDALERGELVSVLEKFCEPFPGSYLYYPQRRHASRALQALIDHLRQWRQAGRGRTRVR
jgi:DNA-binding transcriptional LysR family regulator